MIRYTCAGCADELESPDSMQGLQEVCPSCGATNKVPSAHKKASDPLALLAKAVTEGASEPALPSSPVASPVKLRYRRPVFTFLRSGLGIFLSIAFFMPWLDITCNNNTIMHPSAFNLATGIADSKTKGTMRMTKDMNRSFGPKMSGNRGPSFGNHELAPSTPAKSDLAFWDGPPRTPNATNAEDKGDTKSICARISLYLYGFLLFPLIFALCSMHLWGQFSPKHVSDPPWDAKMQNILTLAAPIATILLVLFGILIKPSEMPPIIDVGLDWGFYLSVLALAAISALLILDRRNSLSQKQVRKR